MILGQGAAASDDEIASEYARFLEDFDTHLSVTVRNNLRAVPHILRRRIGRPVGEWSDAELVRCFATRTKQQQYVYAAFLAFLFFRGYRQATLELLWAVPTNLATCHRPALRPIRERLRTALQEQGYPPGGVGTILELLLWLLAVTGKSLETLTRDDFDAFRSAYQASYQARGYKRRRNARLTPLERTLVHWQVIAPAARGAYQYEKDLAQLRHAPIRDAVLTWLRWTAAKYQPSTLASRRAGVLTFFLWLQATHPACRRLDAVTRSVAVAYATFLQEQTVTGRYAPQYRNDLYRAIRLFYDFALTEDLATAPTRNPFATRDLPRRPAMLPRYLPDADLQAVLTYCRDHATLLERTLVITLLHTGIRASELAALCASDLVEIQGSWKLHIREGKGLKDRMVPLTAECLATLRAWQQQGWVRTTDYLFSWHGTPWRDGTSVGSRVREIGRKAGVAGLTPHRFRHTFAVALLNYGLHEAALQKLLGHVTLTMTLEYARILDATVERAFTEAVVQMREGPLSWVPSFFTPADYTRFADGDTVNWIQLPLGYCRRNPKLHCESDVKCFLCERYALSAEHLPRLQAMRERFLALGLTAKAAVVQDWIARLKRLEVTGAAEAARPACPSRAEGPGGVSEFVTLAVSLPDEYLAAAPGGATGFVPLETLRVRVAGRHAPGKLSG